MKTLKIKEETHKRLVARQSDIYKTQGIKMTLNQVIDTVLTFTDILIGEPKMNIKEYREAMKNGKL